MKWSKGKDHRYYSRNGKQRFDMTLWAYQDELGNTMYQIYKPVGEEPTEND